MDLVYKNEKNLFPVMLVLSLLAWLALLVGTFGAILLYALVFFVAYCFAQSALISYIKGNGVRITSEQFPDLKQQIALCCKRLGHTPEPDAYLMQMGGVLNAFATRFFGRDFIVLYADVVDSLHDNPDALNFYIGHEIGHIKRRHLKWGKVLLPAMALPLIGPAYSRAREYTCDRHGLAACESPANAEHGLATLAAGPRSWRNLNRVAFAGQSQHTDGFWMSFHELVGDYPWLAKRMGAVRALAAGQEVQHPRRHFGAMLLALFVPRIGVAGVAGPIITVAMIGVLAAIAIPAYQDYTLKSKLAPALAAGHAATNKVGQYMMAHHAVPATLEQAGLQAQADGVEVLQLNPSNGVIHIVTGIKTVQGQGELTFTPSVDDKGALRWTCSADGIREQVLPPECR
jgi:Zn-dependent protease with chaperone function/Tfp pilus assembly major pilin PilA